MKAKLLSGVAVVALAATSFTPAHAALAARGAVDPANGFPFWYQDSAGVRLGPCLLLSPLCVPFAAGEIPDPNAPIVFPTNFPGELFYFLAEQVVPTNNGGTAFYEAAIEGGFANEMVVDGDQAVFTRIRFRVTGLIEGASYTITHPYGVNTFVAGPAPRNINDTTDTPGLVAGAFDVPLGASVGPFLTWAPIGDAPAGFIGDPGVDHPVTGSPFGTNFVRIEGPDVGGSGVDMIESNLFGVQGQIAGIRAFADPRGGLYNAAQSVALSASDPAATIHYTTDGTEPTAASPTFAAPVGVSAEGNTTLKFFAVLGADSSPVVTEVYTIDTTPPVVGVSPPSGSYNSAQQVVLSANEPATIHYTTDGSAPTTASPVYSSAISLADDGQYAIKAIGVDRAGNLSAVAEAAYIIDRVPPLAPVFDPKPGIYVLPQDVSVFSGSADVLNIFYTTDGTDPRDSATRVSLDNGKVVHLGCTLCTKTLRATARDLAGNYGPVASGDYTILLDPSM